VIEIRQTAEYRRWFERLRDRQAQFRILARIRRLSLGNPGDAAAVGQGIMELRIDAGPGYRVCFCRRGESIVVLLAGGSKRTQQRDIEKAKQLARGLGEGDEPDGQDQD
jgi:putative addiction module killer protein